MFGYNSMNTEMFKKYYFITTPLKEDEVIDQREDIIGEVKIVKFTKEENEGLNSATYEFYIAYFPNFEQTFSVLIYQNKYMEESDLFKKITSDQTIEEYIVKVAMKRLEEYHK